MVTVIFMIGLCCSWQRHLQLILAHHAAGSGRRVGAVEHHCWHLRLLPHQRHGGEDPHSRARPLHPPVCDCWPVGGPHPAYGLHTTEKTLKTKQRLSRTMVRLPPLEVWVPNNGCVQWVAVFYCLSGSVHCSNTKPRQFPEASVALYPSDKLEYV